jgi:hypothetical protein
VSDALRDAAADLESAREEVEEREDVEAVAAAYRDVAGILERYEERATDWDDFEGYVRFREALSKRLSEIPDDLPEHEAFEAADDVLTTTPQDPPTEADFERARGLLEPAAAYAEALDELESARERYRRARSDARERRDELAERIERLERLRVLGNADLDAPVGEIREPVESYNDAVRDAFAAFRGEAPAREVLRVVSRAAGFPLVDYGEPPADLHDYLRGAEAGEKPVPTLLEFAGRSRASLAHDVADPAALKTAVGSNRTYLEGLDAEPLTVGWPPPEATVLRWRARELVSVLGSFAPEETVAKARALRALSEREAYPRLRRSAVARAELDAGEREQAATGVEGELAEARERLASLEAALEDGPE